jgi:cellulose synthase/poly-beta-1,6-N-acetylglucosamine synthase-like glycosyltransferase
MAAPARKLRKNKKSPVTDNQSPVTEGVTVILAAHNEGYNLSHYLQALLTQDYPTYEVIVVDDGSEDNTRTVVESYSTHDPRLHMTFVPYGARVGSTKKLALTLAAKAAQYEYLLLTDADCVPESDHWISEMMAGFQSSIEIVLGFSPYFYEKGHVNRLVRYDTLFNSLHYLGAALCGHPYMGVGRNLAYRKSLFFESGGFTHLMNSRAGDDDLFVNHVATKANTAVVLSRDSFTWSPAKSSFKDWWQQKRRHLSVSPMYRAASRFRLSLEPITRGLFYALVIAIVGYQLSTANCQLSDFSHLSPFSVLLSIAFGLFMVRWVLMTAILNVSARRMGLHRFSMFTILWFDIVLPLVNLWMLAVPKRQTKW